MSDKITSKHGVPVRLTNERWEHIIDPKKGHPEVGPYRPEVFATVSHPEAIFEGRRGELMAIKEIESKKYLVVIYKEERGEGFIITAFLTRKIKKIREKRQIWP